MLCIVDVEVFAMLHSCLDKSSSIIWAQSSTPCLPHAMYRKNQVYRMFALAVVVRPDYILGT